MARTYRQLAMRLMGMSQKELDQDCSVYIPQIDEYLSIEQVTRAQNSDDVLDRGHAVIELEA